jgi:hypothetical protein
MFGLFRWSAAHDAEIYGSGGGNAPPPPPPLPGTIQGLELMSRLSRIENKLDILLSRTGARGETKTPGSNGSTASGPDKGMGGMGKTPSVVVPREGPGLIEDYSTPPVPVLGRSPSSRPQANTDLVNELRQKIERMRNLKKMGESHGFGPWVDQDNKDRQDRQDRQDRKDQQGGHGVTQ